MSHEKRYQEPDFGAWVKSKITGGGLKIQDFVAEIRKTYSAVSRLLNKGNTGKPQKPDPETVEEYGRVLIRLGLISSIDEAYIAAGYQVDGYVTVPEQDVKPEDLTTDYDIPQIFKDNPDELRHFLEQFEGASIQT